MELIKCIDPNEGEALRRGSTFKPGGLAPPMGAGGEREGGGREDIGREGAAGGREGGEGGAEGAEKEILPEGGIDQMY